MIVIVIYLCFFNFQQYNIYSKCKDADSRGDKLGPTKRFISLT